MPGEGKFFYFPRKSVVTVCDALEKGGGAQGKYNFHPAEDADTNAEIKQGDMEESVNISPRKQDIRVMKSDKEGSYCSYRCCTCVFWGVAIVVMFAFSVLGAQIYIMDQDLIHSTANNV